MLIDEGSASASEIFAGAIQDWDRGVIVGRRSFGKGLVQHQYPFADSSAIRLTVSKYYTPLGRCIQKPFIKGEIRKATRKRRIIDMSLEKYIIRTLLKLNDSLVFITPDGDTVFGGGGIFPDVYVPIDTTDTRNDLFNKIVRKGLIHKFGYHFVSKHRNNTEMFPSIEQFKNNSLRWKRLSSRILRYLYLKKVSKLITLYGKNVVI